MQSGLAHPSCFSSTHQGANTAQNFPYRCSHVFRSPVEGTITWKNAFDYSGNSLRPPKFLKLRVSTDGTTVRASRVQSYVCCTLAREAVGVVDTVDCKKENDIIRLPRLLRFMQQPLAKFISTVRAPKSMEGYASIGGGSPLRRITEEQANALRIALEEKDLPAKVYVGMRYWHPFTEEAIRKIKKDHISKLVVLPLYPQFSISTSGSSLRLLEEIFREDEYLVNMQHTVIPSWYQREGYVKSMATLIQSELQTFERPREVMIFFSAHGVPRAYVEEAGDPYKEEMEHCVRLIMTELRLRGIPNDHTLAYQSRVGPVEWLKPYTDDTIKDLGRRGVKSLLAVPISFVSEHIETLEEIDVEYRELALESGIKNWGRVPALGCEKNFIDDLADAVIEALPYVGAMAVSNIEARQSLIPLGSVEELLATYDTQRRELPPPVPVWEWGWTKSAETWNGRAAMLAVLALLLLEVSTGQGILHQMGILPLFP